MADKCAFPDGMTIKPDGKNELDPCVYKDVEIFTNVNITISRCVKCGHVDISWERTEFTDHIILDEKEKEKLL